MKIPAPSHFSFLLRSFVAVLICLAFGALMRPWTSDVGDKLAKTGLRQDHVQVEGSDALSQQIGFFALGGLRSLAVELLRLDATVAWSKNDWDALENRYKQMTTLQPKREKLWGDASFEMATNAAGYASSRRHNDEHKRASAMRDFIDRGERFLLDGIKNNPDSPVLHAQLGDLYSNLFRRPQFSKAVDALKKSVALGATGLQERQLFYALCRIRGREQEAWDYGRKLFMSESGHRVPSVLCLLFVLQRKIEVPADQRLSAVQLFGSEKRALRILRHYRMNQLNLPVTGVSEYLKAHQPAQNKQTQAVELTQPAS